MSLFPGLLAALLLTQTPPTPTPPGPPGPPAEQPAEAPEVKEEITVSATRSDRRLQDEPLRVEVIDREEIEEKALMTPGSVAMLLGETTGLRVQTIAPSLGAANVRIQGLRGRYAQLLADGLPLYGAGGDSLNLLQVPPLDLGQVEVIKGAASALYGASALGGVINLVSRRPRDNEAQVLVNATSQFGRDVTTWVARAPTGGRTGPCSAATTGNAFRISTMTGGRMCRRSSAASCGRASSSTTTWPDAARDRGCDDGKPQRRHAGRTRRAGWCALCAGIHTPQVDGGLSARWLTRPLRVGAWGGRRGGAGAALRRRWERGVRATWFGEAPCRARAGGRPGWSVGPSSRIVIGRVS